MDHYCPSPEELLVYNLVFLKRGRNGSYHYRGNINRDDLQLRVLIDYYPNGNTSYVVQVKNVVTLHYLERTWNRGFNNLLRGGKDAFDKLIAEYAAKYNLDIT